MVIIPGAQPLTDANEEAAAANIRTFVEEVREQAAATGATRGFTHDVGEPVRIRDADQDGRYGWTLTIDDTTAQILMPGVDLAQLRGTSSTTPCLLVNGDLAWWNDAISTTIPLPPRDYWFRNRG